MKIEALHEFHSEKFSEEWANRFVPSPERIDLFETICQEIVNYKSRPISILELGIGPGFLADFLLNKLDAVDYQGLDFSEAMLAIAKKRTIKFNKQIKLIKADLINENWSERLINVPNIIVSTWALHDLFKKENILNVYKSVYKILPEGGLLLNGDFIKPEESKFEYEGGRIKPSEHLNLLRQAGFQFSVCMKEFEKEVDNPTTANNYACFKAIK